MDECLAQMVEIIGPFPLALSSKWPNYSQCITADGTLRLFDESLGDVLEHIPPLEHLLHEYQPQDATEADMHLLGELLRAMLQYNPADRPTAEELLEFEWLKRRVEVVEHAQPEIDDLHQRLEEASDSSIPLASNVLAVEESGVAFAHVETTPPQESIATHTATPHGKTTKPTIIESQARPPSASSIYFKRLLGETTRVLRGLFRSRENNE